MSKIIYIITQSEMGGAQRYVNDLATFFYSQNYAIKVASGQDGPLIKSLKEKDIHTHVFTNLVRQINPAKDIKVFFEIFAFLKKEKPDIVHLNSSKAGVIGAVAAKCAGVKKIVYTVHGFVFLEPQPFWKKQFYLFAEKISGIFKDAIICVSDFDKKNGIQHRIASEKKFVTIHNGINSAPLRFIEKNEAKKFFQNIIPFPSTHTVIGTIANFYETKGLSYFLQAASQIKKKKNNVIFIIIGEGELRQNLEKQILENNLKAFVILPGRIQDAYVYLKCFDIYMCSSVKEGFPYSILEAYAALVPIVSTNVGGIPEIIKNKKSGLLVEPMDPRALADNCLQLMASETAGKEYVEKGKKILDENFTLDQMLKATSKIYFEKNL